MRDATARNDRGSREDILKGSPAKVFSETLIKVKISRRGILSNEDKNKRQSHLCVNKIRLSVGFPTL